MSQVYRASMSQPTLWKLTVIMATNDYSRRDFIHLCSAAATMLTATSLQACRVEQAALNPFERVQLVNSEGEPLLLADLEAEREYVFFYPYVATPCFLLDLGKTAKALELSTEKGEAYQWQGGVGPNASVVAFAAICAHKLTHPSEPVSFIGYRKKPVGFLDENDEVIRRNAVIQCCSEYSIYDPAQGAKVISGPAPQPLASIALEENDGQLFATGVYGGTVYDRFFERFGFRLEMEFGEKAREQVSGTALVRTTEEYTRQRVEC